MSRETSKALIHLSDAERVLDVLIDADGQGLMLFQIAERAGKQVGLLDGRAIDFGRCLITVKVAR